MIKWGNWNLERKENEIRLSSKAISSIKEKIQAERKNMIETLTDAFEQEKKKGNKFGRNYNFSINQAKKVVDEWNDSLWFLTQYKESDGWNDEDTQKLLNPKNKDGVVNVYSKIDDEIVDCHFLKFWKKLKRNVFTLTKDKINKILNDESFELKNGSKNEYLVYQDYSESERTKFLFYYPQIDADVWFLRQVLYDKTNKMI